MDLDFRKSVGMFMWAVKSSVKSELGPKCIVDPQGKSTQFTTPLETVTRRIMSWRYRGLNKDIKSVVWRKPTGRQLFAILCRAAPVPVFYLWDLGPTAQLKRATPGSRPIRGS